MRGRRRRADAGAAAEGRWPVEAGAPRVLIVACAKDEAPYLPEWIAWHRLIGAAEILIYTNDCTDGTVRLLKRMEVLGHATHAYNLLLTRDGAPLPPQQRALRHMMQDPLYAACDWVLHIDIDEFVVIGPRGRGRFSDLLTGRDGADVIPLVWKPFGANGAERLGARLVTETLIDRAPGRRGAARPFKALTRITPAIRRHGVHRPGAEPPLRWESADGRPLPELATAGFELSGDYGFRGAALHHYALRGFEAYAMKAERGSGARVSRDFGPGYYRDHNGTGRTDLTLWMQRERIGEVVAEMCADPDVTDILASARRRHRRR
ncbi:MAG: glycosyltransferase family 2 protein, partial [Pseudomonadota bacterium]